MAALVVALVVVSGLAVWLWLDDESSTTPLLGWDDASADVMTVIDATFDSFNRGEVEEFGSYFSEEAVFQEVGSGGSGGIEGRPAIVKAMRSLYDLGARYTRVSPAVQRGNMVVFAVECDTCPGFVSEIDAVRFDEDGKITYYWTILGG